VQGFSSRPTRSVRGIQLHPQLPAGTGTRGTAIANSQESCIRVRVYALPPRIFSSTARLAEVSSRRRRCNAERTSRTSRSMPVPAKLT
jgi:hypothetical protein